MASVLTADDFVEKFHSLTGTTIGERRKNLFLLLHQAAQNKLDIDYKQLQPTTLLEENFKLEALIYFNNTEAMLSVLKSENPILIHKIIKKVSPTLVQVLGSLPNDQFLNFLSQISLNTKLKLLYKYGKYLNDTEKAESLFKAIKDMYGIHLATKLLTACSAEFIIEILAKFRHVLTVKQFLIIAKNHPELVSRILEILNKYVDVISFYKKVFNYLLRHNVPLFIDLHKVYDLSAICIGWRATNSILLHNRSNAIENAKIYCNIFPAKYIKRSLCNDDFNLFYYSLFPSSLAQLEKSYDQILTFTANLEVLLTGFRQTYNKELLNESKFISPKILQMMTNEERLKIMKPELKPADFTDDDWTCYLSAPDAIAALKKRILLTSEIKGRAKLVRLLVETCYINKDKVALLEICEYMLAKHRNDHIVVRNGFLKAIKKVFKLENLDMAHWNSINKLTKIFELNGESFHSSDEFITGYLECCLKNKQCIEEALITKINRQISYQCLWVLFHEKPVYEKNCLQIVPSILSQLEGDLSTNTYSYLYAVIDWNMRHPRDTFPLTDNAEFNECFRKAGVTKDVVTWYSWHLTVKYLLHTKTISKRHELLAVYIPKMDRTHIKWLLHSDIKFMVDNLEGCINIALQAKRRTNLLWVYYKLYSHLGVPQKIIDICMGVLSGEGIANDSIKKNALTALSHLMPTSDFLSLKYGTGPYMKNCAIDAAYIETIITYCKTNRHPSIRRALFTMANNLNRISLTQLILQMLEVPNENVHKLALSILFRTMEKHNIMDILERYIKDHNSSTLNRFMLARVFKFFIKNPGENLWDILRLSIKAIDADDEQSFDLVLELDKIPDEYRTSYIILVWGVVEELPDFYSKYSIILLQTMSNSQLPQEFCEMLINKYFFHYDRSYEDFYLQIQAFVCRYICNNSSKLEEYVARALITQNMVDLKLRSYVNYFLKQLCYECITQTKDNILKQFAIQWDTFVKPYEMFHEYLYIQFSLIEIENLSLSTIAERVSGLCSSVTNDYGIQVLYQFAEELKVFAEEHFIINDDGDDTETKWFVFVENISQANDTVVVILLAILLLEGFQASETKDKYDDLIKNFEQRPELEVHMYLQSL